MVLKQLGDRLRELRDEAGISQEQLANEIGLDRTYISGIERGKRNPSIQSLYRIAKGLDVTLEVFFKGFNQ
jgi:transcriptional regulator with XRE-family HTH domain